MVISSNLVKKFFRNTSLFVHFRFFCLSFFRQICSSTLPSRIDVTPRQLFFREFPTPQLIYLLPDLLKMAQTSHHHAYFGHHVY